MLKFNQELTYKQDVDLGLSLALLLAINGVLANTHQCSLAIVFTLFRKSSKFKVDQVVS